jgi:hypothetical protein
VIPGEHDEDDTEYRRKLIASHELRRTAALDIGFMPLPGATLEEKHQWRLENLTPQAVDTLYSAISNLTKDPVALAHFTT